VIREDIDHAIYIDWYLSGQQGQAPYRPGPRAQWLQDIVDDPHLDDVEDLIASALPEFRPPPHLAAIPPCEAKARKTGIWILLSNIVFYAALAGMVVGALVFNSVSGQIILGFVPVLLLSTAARVVLPRAA